MATCELCADPAHTSSDHQAWLDWHNDLLAGKIAADAAAPELRRSNTVSPRDAAYE